MVAKLLKVCLDIDFQKVSASVSTQIDSQIPTNPSSSTNEIITPYVVKQRELLKCQVDQKTLVIMDVFTGQMTAEVLNAYKEANILIINVPANMTKYYQPLDLAVIEYAKRFLESKFIEWYSSQVRTYLDNGVSIDNIEVGLQLSKIKPIHAGWLVEF